MISYYDAQRHGFDCFRPTKNSILECRSVIEEKMWFWEGMSSLANNLKILLLALPNRSGDSCLVPVSINQIPTRLQLLQLLGNGLIRGNFP